MMNAPNSASSVYTGQSGGNGTGQGEAAILDRHPDVGMFVQNIFNQKRQQDLMNARQQREDAKRLQGILKGPDLGKVPLRSQQELAEGLTAYKDLAVQMGMGKVKGKDGRKLDPLNPYDLEAQQMLQDKEFELVSQAEAARSQEKRLMEILEAAKDSKYDQGKIADYIERFQKAPSVAERQALLDENPLVERRSTFDIVKDMAPQMARIVQESGNKTTIDELIQPENIQILAENWMLDHPEDYEAGLRDGRWKDEQGFADAIYQIAASQKPAKRSVTFDEPRQASSGSGNTLGETPTGVQVVATYDPSVSEDPNGNINSVQIIYDEQNAKKVSLQDEQGKTRTIVSTPTAKKRNNGEWYIEADVSETVEIPYSTKQIEENEALVALGQEPLPKEKKTVTKTLSFPLDNRKGKQGNLNYQVMSALTGRDFQQWVGDQTGGQAPAKKTIKRSELAKKASDAGYSVAEYEEELKNRGITIE